jgi:tetratricopeptide (TPR) repeat protein
MREFIHRILLLGALVLSPLVGALSLYQGLDLKVEVAEAGHNVKKTAADYLKRGEGYFQNCRYDRAIADFTRALKLNPRLATAYDHRANAYYETGRYDQAISDFQKALELDPGLAKTYFHKGPSASICCLTANTRFAQAYLKRGEAYRRKGRYNRAIADFNQALKLNPRWAEAYFKKARACQAAGRRREAIEAYRNFIQYAPPKYSRHIEIAKKQIKKLEK